MSIQVTPLPVPTAAQVAAHAAATELAAAANKANALVKQALAHGAAVTPQRAAVPAADLPAHFSAEDLAKLNTMAGLA